jgi:chromosome segregation ATPase
MQPEQRDEALFRAEEENRQLRAAILEMRAALERLQSEKEQAAQTAAHEAAREVAHVRETVSALRDQLESQENEKRTALQQAAADTYNEIQTHIATIRAQRQEMENLIEAHAVQLQQLKLASQGDSVPRETTRPTARAGTEARHGGS